MQHNLPNDLIKNFADIIGKYLGLHYTPDHYHQMLDQLQSQLKLKQEKPFTEYVKKVVSDSHFRAQHLDEMAEALTIGETSFFRNGCGFEELREYILPELIKKKTDTGKKELRIWSAACCLGNEPYSIAMLIDELLPSRSGWNIQILGTDINKKFLEMAEKGIYRNWSFRSTSEEIVQKYFHKEQGSTYAILPKIRSMVTFRYLNLVEDSYPSLENGTNGLDLILCNNTLIYFSDQEIQKVIKKFKNSLIEDGVLIVTAVEASMIRDPMLEKMRSSCHIFVKTAKPQAATSFKPSKKAPPKPIIPLPKMPAPPQPAKPVKVSFDDMYNEGKYEECVNALKDNHKDPHEIALLIRSLANLGQLEEAEKICRETIQANELLPQFHFLLANILQERNQKDEAITELKKALFLDQKYIMAHFSLAYLLTAKNNQKQAKIHKRIVLEELQKLENKAVVPGSENILVERLKELTNNMGSA